MPRSRKVWHPHLSASDAVVLTNSRMSSRAVFRLTGRRRCPLGSVRPLHAI